MIDLIKKVNKKKEILEDLVALSYKNFTKHYQRKVM